MNLNIFIDTPRTKVYAGIGSRQTPKVILTLMKTYAKMLDESGFTLRSGGADGADSAFANATNNKDIFLPWKWFNNVDSCFTEPTDKAMALAKEVHPAWKLLSNSARLLMARNCHQVLGINLDYPSDFVLCWTPDGAETEEQTSVNTGGTGQAIRLANRWNIPVFNLKKDDAIYRLTNHLKSHPFYKKN